MNFSASIRYFALCGALAAFTGCHDSQLRVQTAETVSSSVAAQPNAAATAGAQDVAPLRRAKPMAGFFPQLSGLLSAFAQPVIVTVTEADGQFRVRCSKGVDADVDRWLAAQEFKAVGSFFERRVPPADVPALLAALQAMPVPSLTNRLTAPQVSQATRYFTGHPLDLALADSTVFFELDGRSADDRRLARSGSVYVDEANALVMGGHALSGLKPVPTGTAAIKIAENGEVNAFAADGSRSALGRVSRVRTNAEQLAETSDGYWHAEARQLKPVVNSGALVLPGHLDVADATDWWTHVLTWMRREWWKQALANALQSAEQPGPATVATTNLTLPLTLHAPLNRAAEHLQGLGISVQKSRERTVIGVGADRESLGSALIAVMDGLTRRIEIHRENLRNAGKTRDAEGRLNPYRRKLLRIGPHGELQESDDQTALPRNYKPGDPDAGPDGFVVLSNVNQAVESAELKGVLDEYKLIRAALERVKPSEIYPDPQ